MLPKVIAICGATVSGTVKWNIDYYRKIKILKLMKSI